MGQDMGNTCRGLWLQFHGWFWCVNGGVFGAGGGSRIWCGRNGGDGRAGVSRSARPRSGARTKFGRAGGWLFAFGLVGFRGGFYRRKARALFFDLAQQESPKIHVHFPGRARLQPDVPSGQRAADEVLFVPVVDGSAPVDSSFCHPFILQFVGRSFPLSLALFIHLRGRLHAQRFVRAHLVKFTRPLLQRRLPAFVLGAFDFSRHVLVHSFVRSVVLGAGGAASFQFDSERNPPCR